MNVVEMSNAELIGVIHGYVDALSKQSSLPNPSLPVTCEEAQAALNELEHRRDRQLDLAPTPDAAEQWGLAQARLVEACESLTESQNESEVSDDAC